MITLLLGVCVYAYLPGENSFVTLPNSNGVFGNPALLPAFDSPGFLVSYEKNKDDIHDFRTGFHWNSLGVGFEYLTDGGAINESRWSLTHGFDFWDRAFFIGQRVEAFRSADFEGTAWNYSPGVLFRPWQFVALGYTSHNLAQTGPDYQKRDQEYGATFRPFSSFSVSWNTLNFDTHRLLVNASLYLFDVGFQIPLVGENDEYKLTVSRPLENTHTCATFFDDFKPHSVAWGFHAARNPNVSLMSHVVRVPLDIPIQDTEEGFSFLGPSSMGLETVRNHLALLLADKSATLIIFDFSHYHAGTAASKEIQRGIQRLRKDGRRVSLIWMKCDLP
jgi:protease-4